MRSIGGVEISRKVRQVEYRITHRQIWSGSDPSATPDVQRIQPLAYHQFTLARSPLFSSRLFDY